MANREPPETMEGADFKFLEIILVRKDLFGNEKKVSHALLIENSQETQDFVQEKIDDIVRNVIAVINLEQREIQKASALEPLFMLLSATSGDGTLSSLSLKLKKSLLVMALERYQGDFSAISKLFGITADELRKELVSCGLKEENE